MKSVFLKSFVLLVSTLSVVAAAKPIRLGDPSYGGTGCPAGTASVAISPDREQISVLFDGFATETGGASGRKIDRKACSLAVPIEVPAGYSIALSEFSLKGFNSLGAGANSRIDVEAFWAGSVGPRLARTFDGPLDAEVKWIAAIDPGQRLWSPCGQSVTFRFNISVITEGGSGTHKSTTILDDLKDVHFQSRSCQ
jgi:hypothetical protein